MQTLNQFIKESENKWPLNAYVRQRGFKTLYVRRSRRWLDGTWVNGVLDIANVEVMHPGRGLFTRLAERLFIQKIPLYVECVINHRFAATLDLAGFTRVKRSGIDRNIPPSFYKLPKKG